MPKLAKSQHKKGTAKAPPKKILSPASQCMRDEYLQSEKALADAENVFYTWPTTQATLRLAGKAAYIQSRLINQDKERLEKGRHDHNEKRRRKKERWHRIAIKELEDYIQYHPAKYLTAHSFTTWLCNTSLREKGSWRPKGTSKYIKFKTLYTFLLSQPHLFPKPTAP